MSSATGSSDRGRARSRRAGVALAAVGIVLAAACGPGAVSSPGPTSATGDGTCPAGTRLHAGQPAVEEAPTEEDALFPWERDDPAVVDGFDADRIISGGPPPDGIEPIEAPCFESVAAAGEWLDPDSPVLSIEVDGDRRAYPLAIMTQHEIVNDVIGGRPVVVTYCPLCNSGLAFDRTVDGQVLDFGTSGRLYQSNLVMYDRQHKSLWVQFSGRAVVGEPWVGTELDRIPTALIGFGEFADAAPDGSVLSPATNPTRNYGRNPYPGYENRGSSFLFEGPTDDRLPPNSRVVGLDGPDGQDPTAIPLERLRDRRVLHPDVAGRPLVVWWAPGAASALDAPTVDAGRDVGQTGAFRRDGIAGEPLTFRPAPDADDRFVDEQTSSTWNVLGRAVDGPLEGEQLQRVPVDDTFWFVWFAFRPATTVLGGDGS